MSRTLLLTSTVAVAFAVASVGAQAKVSSTSEFHGYQQCLAAADQESNGLIATRNYYIEKEGADTEYFINATRWENGDRAYVRIYCETTAAGKNLVSTVIESGAFRLDQEPTVRVEVAQN